MRRLRVWFVRLGGLLHKERRDRDLAEELDSHLQMHIEDNLRVGMTAEEARRNALIKLGGVESTKEAFRDQRGLPGLEALFQDVRHGLRILRKNPGFTAVAVVTLALGIGANTTIFSAVDAVLLRSLAFDQPQRLVQLWEDDPGGTGSGRNTVSGPAFADWKEQNTALENLAAYSSVALNITDEGEPERLRGLRVSASYLQVFRINPILGRGFMPEEDQPGKDKVVLLTHGLWQRRFGGDTNLVGRGVRLGNETRTVVGVLPPEPLLWAEREFLVPLVLASEARARNRGDHWLRVVARLKRGVTSEQARAEINAITQRQNQMVLQSEADTGATVVPFQEQVTGDIRPKLLLLMGAAAFFLLLACADIASLVLARATERRQEIAIRVALGAGRWRVIRQLLTESVLLSLLGGAVGSLLAFGGADLLKHLALADVPRAEDIGLDGRVLAFALLASVVTGLIFGLAPALQTARLSLSSTLKEGGSGSRSGAGRRAHGALIATETALALVLLVGFGLMARSLFKLEAVSPGFNPKNVLSLSLSLDSSKYPDAERRALFCSQIIERLEALTGVEAAGIGGGVFNWNNTSIRAEGQANQPEGGYGTDYDYIFGSYFRALGVPLLKGRGFTERDYSVSASRVAILSDALARRLFPDQDPVGQRVQAFGQTLDVVGVVGDVRHHGLDSAALERLYLPSQGNGGSLVVRTRAAPLALVGGIRKEIFTLDPDQPVSNVQTLEAVVTGSLADRRLVLVLLGLFASAALLLAAVGLYGVMAYSVSQRTREIGIRMALGAQRFDVLKLVLSQGMKLVFIGVSIGVVGALMLTRVMRTLLYGVEPTDPLTFAAVSILLLAVALFACWLPSHRAASLDPLTALRYE